jgi:hypothetical protein
MAAGLDLGLVGFDPDLGFFIFKNYFLLLVHLSSRYYKLIFFAVVPYQLVPKTVYVLYHTNCIE